MNPLGMTEALIGAMVHSAELHAASQMDKSGADNMKKFTTALRQALHKTFRYGQGTRDMAGPEGLTTESFIEKVAWRLGRYVAKYEEDISHDLNAKISQPSGKYPRN